MTQSKDRTVKVKGWKKNKRERIKISLSVYRGYEQFSIRKWYKDSVTGEVKATQVGINLPLSKLSKTIAALKLAQKMVRSGAWRK
jgi:transcriptional coactivator p15 (PC4)